MWRVPLLLLLLSGCVVPNSEQACRITKVADVPLVLENRLVHVDATIGGKPARFLLDTGANLVVITKAAAARLGLGYDPNATSVSMAVDALTTAPVTLPTRIVVGGHALDAVNLIAIPSASALDGASGDDGLLGLGVLGRYDLELDVPHRRLTLYAPRTCPDGPSPLPGRSVTFKTPPTLQHFLYLPGQFDGRALNLAADTGASSTYLNASRLGLPDGAFASDRALQVKTAGPGQVTGHVHRFATAEIADIKVNGALVPVGPMKAEVDGLAGLDVLGRRRVWMSFAGRAITFQQ